jgi:hypothetical protein
MPDAASRRALIYKDSIQLPPVAAVVLQSALIFRFMRYGPAVAMQVRGRR